MEYLRPKIYMKARTLPEDISGTNQDGFPALTLLERALFWVLGTN